MSKIDTDMTLEQIEAALVCYPFSPFYCRSHLVVPNVSWGFLNHEADLLVVSKAKLLTEVEIKRSWADFLADFKKGHDHSHPLIARFYYAVPASIGQKVFDYLYEGEYKAKHPFSRSRLDRCTENNPKGYGLIIYDLEDNPKSCCITADSSLLNNTQVSESEEKKLLRLLGMRVWRLKQKVAEEGWISTAVELPKPKKTNVLISDIVNFTTDYGAKFAGYYDFSRGDWWEGTICISGKRVTHWKPYPKLPKKGV